MYRGDRKEREGEGQTDRDYIGYMCRAQALGPRTSAVVARGLSSGGSRAPEHRVDGCGTQA